MNVKHSSIATRIGAALVRLASGLVSIEDAPQGRTRATDDGINPMTGLPFLSSRAGMDVSGQYVSSPPRTQNR